MSKTNRSNDIRPHKSLLIALTLAATGFVANNAFAQDADAIRQQADAKVASIEAAIEDGATALTQATQSACVQQIGHILLFYKASPDEPRIVFVKHPTPSR